jgi:alkylation response protein AidB-like acyl-CoA dehydrogenase
MIRSNTRRFSVINKLNALPEDYALMQEAALAFGKEYIAPHIEEWDRDGYFPKNEVFKKSSELGMGFSGIVINSEYGGSELGRLASSVIFEALAYYCPAISAYFTIHNMNGWLLQKYGNDEQKQKWLPPMCEFELLSSYCLSEPGAGSDAMAMKTIAVEDGDDWVINGSKMFISGGEFTDIYLVMLKTGEKEVSCIAVPRDAKGLGFGKLERKMGWKTSPT